MTDDISGLSVTPVDAFLFEALLNDAPSVCFLLTQVYFLARRAPQNCLESGVTSSPNARTIVSRP